MSDCTDNVPPSCALPTGLGKTSVIAVWLIALAHGAKLPRRLVYVVNRRTVVDQTTDEVENLQKRLPDAGLSLTALAISTLRGEHADNRKWTADPSRPAVICGTVDLIGSGLLFSSYRVGRNTKPLHAGFLGQDVLLVHDEAHLEPAFQKLVVDIAKEQTRERGEFSKPLRVMELTATPRGAEKPFTLSELDYEDETVKKRMNSKKSIRPHFITDERKEAAEKIAALALAHGESQQPILVFVRTVADAKAVQKKLEAKHKNKVALLVGPLRGYERDALATTNKIFARFLPKVPADAEPGTVYLVCTAAGEVGVNISAGHMVGDLPAFDSLAQRLGRVNRFGDGAAFVDLVVPTEFPEDRDGPNRKLTFELLKELPPEADNQYSASPKALGNLPADRKAEAASPKPSELDTTAILFDAWAMTTLKDLPGRPAVEPYLHGVDEDESADTLFAWRTEVGLFPKLPELTGDEKAEQVEALTAYLDGYGLKSHELLRERTYNVRSHLKDLAKREPALPAWVLDYRGELSAVTLEELAEYEYGDLAGRTIILPPEAGGLDKGILDGKVKFDPDTPYDVADMPKGDAFLRLRFELTKSDEGETYSYTPLASPTSCTLGKPESAAATRLGPLPLVRQPDVTISEKDNRYLVAFVAPFEGNDETRSRQSREEQKLNEHLLAAEHFAVGFVERLELPADVAEAVRLAARWHDLGKNRRTWQRGIGNYEATPLAKSGNARRILGLEGYRHEFGSLLDAASLDRFRALSPNQQDLVLHLIAAHHGFARPHFPEDRAFDPENPDPLCVAEATAGVRRAAHLSRTYGRWGLAYLESLVRAADHAASDPDKVEPIKDRLVGPVEEPRKGVAYASRWNIVPAPSITVAVDPTNPGQFFACCGLLELADRLNSGAEGWFEKNQFHLAGTGSLDEFIDNLTAAELMHDVPDDPYSSPVTIGKPFRPLKVDWWTTGRIGAKDLKVWAGTMESYGIARAMQLALRGPQFKTSNLFNEGMVVPDANNPKNKKEPYYFDARRGPNAHPRDVGFSINAVDMTTTAHPAVELLCLIGLQSVSPAPTEKPRVYDYYTWPIPLARSVAAAVGAGAAFVPGRIGYRFESWFRTGQRKHKAFRTASLIPPKGV